MAVQAAVAGGAVTQRTAQSVTTGFGIFIIGIIMIAIGIVLAFIGVGSDICILITPGVWVGGGFAIIGFGIWVHPRLSIMSPMTRFIIGSVFIIAGMISYYVVGWIWG